jgi:hypothetical protein
MIDSKEFNAVKAQFGELSSMLTGELDEYLKTRRINLENPKRAQNQSVPARVQRVECNGQCRRSSA